MHFETFEFNSYRNQVNKPYLYGSRIQLRIISLCFPFNIAHFKYIRIFFFSSHWVEKRQSKIQEMYICLAPIKSEPTHH